MYLFIYLFIYLFMFVGDSAYPLSRKLLTPFRNNGRLTRKQLDYNFSHSSLRMLIEHCFGIVKSKLFILDERLKFTDLTVCNSIIHVAFMIHNMFVTSNDVTEYPIILNNLRNRRQIIHRRIREQPIEVYEEEEDNSVGYRNYVVNEMFRDMPEDLAEVI
jgi:DDE superfamily endonuclease